MTRRDIEPVVADRPHTEPSASDRRAGGKRRARRETEPYGPVREPGMTKEQWRAYHEGPKPTREQVQAMFGGPRFDGFRDGYKSSVFGLRPCDWEDPRYRAIYDHFMIFREDADEDVESESAEDIAIALEATGDPEWELVLAGPGRHDVKVLLSFIARFAGKGLVIRNPYDPSHGHAVVRVTKTMKRLMVKRGFHIEEINHDFNTAPV